MRNSLVVRFIVTLQDRLSGPLGVIRRRIEALRQLAGRVALLGTALAGLSVAGPVREAAAFEGALRSIAITAGASGAEARRQVAQLHDLIEQVAYETNVMQRDLAAGAAVLASAGGPAAENLRELVPIIGRAAAAAGAAPEHIGQTVVAMMTNLELSVEQVQPALAGLVQAGKEGRFELRDMAQHFDGLSAAARGIGLTGPSAVASLAAALQVARQGAGSASQAATNLQNTLNKMTAPDAVRAFRDMGVDIEAVMRDAATRGMNPFEAIIQKLRERTGGDMFRVQELFADSQVLDFLRPMIAQTAEYIRVRNLAANAPTSVIDTDMRTRAEGLEAALKRLNGGWEALNNRLWLAAEGPLMAAGEGLWWLSRQVIAVEQAFPGLLGGGAAVIAGLIALSAAIAAVSAVAGPLAAVIGALASPFVLAGIAIVGAALYIRAEWERFSGFFEAMGQGLSNIVSGFVENITGLLTGDFARGAEGTMMIWRGLEAFFSGLWGAVRTLFEDFGAFVDGWTGGAVTAWVDAIRGAFQGLLGFFEGLFTAITAPFESFISRVVGAIERVRALADNVAQRFSAGQDAQAERDAAPRAMGRVQERQAAARAALGSGAPTPADAALAAAGGAPAQRTTVGGEIVVRAAPGTEILQTQSANPEVPVTAGARGQTRGRP